MAYRRISATSAHRHDPTVLLDRAANNPFVQPDIEQMARMRQTLERQGTSPIGNRPGLDARYSAPGTSGELVRPIRVQNVLNTVKINTVNEVKLLIRKNLFRLAFRVFNPTSGTLYTLSYGPPSLYTGVVAGIPLGIPILPGMTYQEPGPCVSIDDIYISSDGAPVTIQAYEAIEVPEANE